MLMPTSPSPYLRRVLELLDHPQQRLHGLEPSRQGCDLVVVLGEQLIAELSLGRLEPAELGSPLLVVTHLLPQSLDDGPPVTDQLAQLLLLERFQARQLGLSRRDGGVRKAPS
jgi:hypothetical protein